MYEKTEAQFGTTDIPINTFSKIWIVPENSTVYEHEGSAFVVKSHLKVMLEEDYVALNENINSEKFGMKNFAGDDAEVVSGVTSEIVKEILIPEIEREVNTGTTFANLRQIYNSMILATWYKIKLKDSLLGKVYVDQNKVKGVDIEDINAKQKIYDQYIEAFKEGVYNYIKEDYDPATQQIIPRKYFSGGTQPVVAEDVRSNLIEGAPDTLSGLDSTIVQGGLSRNSKKNSTVRNVKAFTLEQTDETDPDKIAANAKEVRDDEAMLTTIEGRITSLAQGMQMDREIVQERLIKNVRPEVLLEDIAESVGIDKKTALQIMEEHGIAVKRKGLAYDVQDSIFDSQKWDVFLKDLIERSPEPKLARFNKVAFERVITTALDISGLFFSFSGDGTKSQNVFASTLNNRFPDLSSARKLDIVLKLPNQLLSEIDIDRVINPEAGTTYEDSGIRPSFSLPSGEKADSRKVNEIVAYQDIVVQEVLSKGSFFHKELI